MRGESVLDSIEDRFISLLSSRGSSIHDPEFTPEEPIPELTEVEDSLIEEEPEPQFGSNTSPMVESDAVRAVDENLSSEQDVPPTSDEPINETER